MSTGSARRGTSSLRSVLPQPVTVAATSVGEDVDEPTGLRLMLTGDQSSPARVVRRLSPASSSMGRSVHAWTATRDNDLSSAALALTRVATSTPFTSRVGPDPHGWERSPLTAE